MREYFKLFIKLNLCIMKLNSQKKILVVLLIIAAFFYDSSASAQSKQPVKFSTAGFFEVKESGRQVYNFNTGWRFLKADTKGAEQISFNDAAWEVVNTPHGLELLPAEASGGKNYQGKAWYRKHFTMPNELAGKKITLHFEAIMGKAKIFVNGKLAAEHFGGYLPVIVDLTKAGISFQKENVIAVLADNSDDPLYPPGKSQTVLDFCYFGGIYRDVWVVATNERCFYNKCKCRK